MPEITPTQNLPKHFTYPVTRIERDYRGEVVEMEHLTPYEAVHALGTQFFNDLQYRRLAIVTTKADQRPRTNTFNYVRTTS